MKLAELLTDGGGILLILLTLIQISPLKVNPWDTFARWLGKMINGEVLDKLGSVERRLNEHIKEDDKRDADMHRARILHFNTELLRGIKHTKEDFSEVFYNIDCYEKYCREHPDYKNNRATHAIANIGRVYDERLEKRDFL